MPKKPKARTAVKDAKKARREARAGALLPSPNPLTNLLIADIVLRGASTLFRKSVEKRVAKADMDDAAKAEALVDGRSLVTTLGLYTASKLATRSPAGLGLVTGGLVLKTLYDRGKARQQRLAKKRINSPD